MEMDCYDFDSYRISLDNLRMLKLFHDEGVDVSSFRSFMSHVHHGCTETYDIFSKGIQMLFDCIFYDYDDIHRDDFPYPKLKDKCSENIVIIKEKCFPILMGSALAKDLEEKIKNVAFSHSEATLTLLDDHYLLLDMTFMGMELSEVIEALVKLKEESEDLINKLKEYENDTKCEAGYSKSA